MIVEYIRYELTSHAPADLISAYEQAAPHLQAAPECLGYDLSACEEEPNSLTLRIRWQSTEAHMQCFRRGPNFPPFLSAIRPFVGEIAEMRHYIPTGLKWSRQDALS